MTLDDILKEWEKDSPISPTNLDGTSIETAKLHAKYLSLWSNAKLRLRRAENQKNDLIKDKWLYYEGKMSREEIESKQWKPDPFDGLTLTKDTREKFYKTDPEVQQSEDRIEYLKTIIDTLKEILDNLKWRHTIIKNIIDIRKFESGS